VVPHQTDGRPGSATTDEPFEHTPGIGTAVDVIPEKNAGRVRCGMPGHIRLDSCENFVQQVQAAMDIPNGINSGALGHAGPRRFNVRSARRPNHALVALFWTHQAVVSIPRYRARSLSEISGAPIAINLGCRPWIGVPSTEVPANAWRPVHRRSAIRWISGLRQAR